MTPRTFFLPSAKILWGIGSFQALAMFRRGLFYAFLSIYLRYFLGLSVTETTLFATLPMIINIAAQNLIWGRFSDRKQLRRTLILWGEMSGAVGTVIVWFIHVQISSPHLAGFAIILGLSGVEFFWSMSNIGWSALISDVFPEARRNTVIGYLTSIGGMGRLGGVWIGGLLYDGLGKMYEGWGFHSGTLFFIAAAVMLISIIPILYLPEGGIRAEEISRRECDDACEAASLHLYWIFLIAMVFINFGRNGVMIVQSQYLVLKSGFAVSSRMLSYIFNTSSAALIVFGLLAGRIGRWLGNGRAVCLGAAIALVYLLLFAFTNHLLLIFLGSMFWGTADVIIRAASYALASILIPPARRGRLFGLYNATLFLSWGLAGTLISGPVVDFMISRGFSEKMAYRSAYLSGVVLVLIGLSIQLVLVFVVFPRAGITRTGTQR